MTDSTAQNEGGNAVEFPTAKITSTGSRRSGRSLTTRLWGVTLAALAVSIGLVVWNQKPAGPTITIRFEQGHGLRPGNSLQHRGIEVGNVTSVELADKGAGVAARVELQPNAKTLARDGSQFWIVRPRVSLTRITGLDTVVGARYIEVQPGSADAAMKLNFDGLETPLTLSDSDTLEIHIRFNSGDGLSVGDEVRHRGIVTGEVTSVDLNEDLSGVLVKVRLLRSASRLARAGSQFWVERPTLSAVEVRGLDTLLGGRYIAMQPGPADAERSLSFTGLANAPAGELPDGGVEITLEATHRGGLRRGVPVLYRGQNVGHVIAVSLASDAATVEARVWIDAPYRQLVRDNTRFWMNSGFDVSVGLDGLKLSADTLSSIIVGGVSLATPSQPGAIISTGHRFECVAKPEQEWLTWQARIPLGVQQISDNMPLPVPVRAALRWQERRFGFRRDRQRSGWILQLSDGRLLGPADLLTPVESALDGRTTLEAAGETVDVTTAKPVRTNGLAILNSRLKSVGAASLLSPDRLEHPSEPVDCLIVTAGSESALSVTAARFRVQQAVSSDDDPPGDGAADFWIVDPGVPLTSDHHGACVVSRVSGQVVGLLTVSDSVNQVVLIPSGFAAR